ncbi:hypothetical protein COLO4_06681 [Corchorus olitorius]|uniref:Uncharacterized protein n=1 Tax=Corchorus olitorius TaxID=93759 RepID=A0A1R3KMA8_9ROSI|nr:hypothetical protein COLO4_06681 [Corchorus olitorius]
MVARLTPDQKVACSIHVGFKSPIPNGFNFFHFSFHLLVPASDLQKPRFGYLLKIDHFCFSIWREMVKVEFNNSFEGSTVQLLYKL